MTTPFIGRSVPLRRVDLSRRAAFVADYFAAEDHVLRGARSGGVPHVVGRLQGYGFLPGMKTIPGPHLVPANDEALQVFHHGLSSSL